MKYFPFKCFTVFCVFIKTSLFIQILDLDIDSQWHTSKWKWIPIKLNLSVFPVFYFTLTDGLKHLYTAVLKGFSEAREYCDVLVCSGLYQ